MDTTMIASSKLTTYLACLVETKADVVINPQSNVRVAVFALVKAKNQAKKDETRHYHYSYGECDWNHSCSILPGGYDDDAVLYSQGKSLNHQCVAHESKASSVMLDIRGIEYRTGKCEKPHDKQRN